MKRRPKHPLQADDASAPAADANAILQIKVWLVGISPMVWRRVLVPTTFTLRELHGVIQVVMGWEGALKDGSEVLALDQETRWRLEDVLERGRARERAQGRPFSRRDVNAGLRDGEHHNLMHQQY
jgi:hypothetical protein